MKSSFFMKKIHAILFPNLLRCVDENLLNFLDSCKDSSQIFIVTDRSFEKQAQILFDRYDAEISFIEDLADIETSVPKSEWDVTWNATHSEWIKLEHALRYLILWEQKNNHCFEYIHRFRTDVSYPVVFQDYIKPLIQADFPEKTLLHYYAMNFSGPRKAMLELIGYPKFFTKYKKDKEFFKQLLTCIDAEALARSEYDPCAHFEYCFPVGYLTSEDKISNFHLALKNEYSSYIEASVAFVKRIRLESLSDELYNHFNSWNTKLIRVFSEARMWSPHTEISFFRYINYLGFATKPYLSKNQFIETPVKFSRHATTPFTEKIFNLLQVRNYSFFEIDYRWEEEIALFLGAGGDARHAVQKFTSLHLPWLTDASCVTLYRIIDILNQPNWLSAHRKYLIEEIKTRGIDPPKTLLSQLGTPE